jgi:hypothetical protein
MTSNIERDTATIYQFPLRGRFAPLSPFADSTQASALVPSRATAAALDGSWYHAEAILEAELAPKH